MTQDLRFALRQLRRTPGFAAVTVLTFALGIGANTAVFSVMNAVVLRLLPVSEPERLVYLHTTGRPPKTSQTGYDDTSLSMPVFEQLRAEGGIFAELIGFVPLDTSRTVVRHGNQPETAWADMVTGNFFSGLGVSMARGVGFTAEDESQHAQKAVISHTYWTRRFAGDPGILGGTLFVKGVPFTVVGIAPPGFAGVEHNNATDVWIPLQSHPELKPWGRSAQSIDGVYTAPNWWFLLTIGRLAAGVSEAEALARAQTVFQRAAFSATAPPEPGAEVPKLFFTPARGIQGLNEAYRRPLTILMAMVGLVLLIACGNVSLLLAARNAAREREFSLRSALGASRGRVFRQLIAESALLVAAGTILGWGFALFATRALAAWSALEVTLAPDHRVLLFTLAVSTAAAIAFGLAPLRGLARIAPGTVLKASNANIAGGRRLGRGDIVIAAQIALCVVLLVGAGLLARTLANLNSADLGFRASGLLVFGVTPPPSAGGDAAMLTFYRDLSARLRGLPGVQSVTLMSNRIGSGWSNNTAAVVDGKPPDPKGFSPMRWNAVGPDYFRVLEIPLVLGRDFTDADDGAAPPVVIINETFAQRYLAGQNPIGHRVSMSREYTVVGVAANSRYTSVRESERPMAYFPYAQVPPIGAMHVEVRTSGDPAALLPAAARVLHQFGPDLPLLQPMTQQQQFSRSFSDERLFSRLAVFFGLLAAALVASGLYGTLTYRVGRRTSEIGVRMALGAPRGQVLWMVLRESLFVCAAGIGIGIPIALWSSRLLKATLFGLSPQDPWAIGGALIAIVIVTLGASFLPARRAASVDPMVALRYE